MSKKNPLTTAGIEPTSFRFLAQYLNHCATAVPIIYIELQNVPFSNYFIKISLFLSRMCLSISTFLAVSMLWHLISSYRCIHSQIQLSVLSVLTQKTICFAYQLQCTYHTWQTSQEAIRILRHLVDGAHPYKSDVSLCSCMSEIVNVLRLSTKV